VTNHPQKWAGKMPNKETGGIIAKKKSNEKSTNYGTGKRRKSKVPFKKKRWGEAAQIIPRQILRNRQRTTTRTLTK